MSKLHYNENLFKVYLSNPLYRNDIYELPQDIHDINSTPRSKRVVFISFQNPIKENEVEEIQKAISKFGQTQKYFRRKDGGKTVYYDFVEQVNIDLLIFLGKR